MRFTLFLYFYILKNQLFEILFVLKVVIQNKNDAESKKTPNDLEYSHFVGICELILTVFEIFELVNHRSYCLVKYLIFSLES